MPMTSEPSRKFQLNIADMKMLMTRENRAEDPLAPYASAVLKILKSYQHCPLYVKPLVEAVYEFGVDIISNNSKTDSDDLSILQHIETIMIKPASSSPESNVEAQAKIYIERFQSKVCRTTSELKLIQPPEPRSQAHRNQQSQSIPQVVYKLEACTFNHATGNIVHSTNNNASSYLNCNNNVIDSEIGYGTVDVRLDNRSSEARNPQSALGKVQLPPLRMENIGRSISEFHSDLLTPSRPSPRRLSPLVRGNEPIFRSRSEHIGGDIRVSPETHLNPGRDIAPGNIRKALSTETKFPTPVDKPSVPFFFPLALLAFRPNLASIRQASRNVYMLLHRQMASSLSAFRPSGLGSGLALPGVMLTRTK
ncbi:hypothetical protein DFJ43DRAFT_1089513 [Lentinula guzmanii]|uniref:Uncharacterized protein n=1 Tax=Lentinula guzmanii TaxID=2804957 RepID=A0AA38MS95_9AGAR|nr:hypothetical protein DFJ43DRAFT_1089513 [Lentinula guzmanii]